MPTTPPAPVASFQPMRINAPGYGPKIISYVGTIDLSALPILAIGAGAPAGGTLLAGNGKYLVNDFYLDSTGNALYRCSTAGTKDTSKWIQISGAGGGNWNYRGLYDPTLAGRYNTFDVVSIQDGTATGMYLSTMDSNPNPPDTGPGWVQISTLYGQWM